MWRFWVWWLQRFAALWVPSRRHCRGTRNTARHKWKQDYPWCVSPSSGHKNRFRLCKQHQSCCHAHRWPCRRQANTLWHFGKLTEAVGSAHQSLDLWRAEDHLLREVNIVSTVATWTFIYYKSQNSGGGVATTEYEDGWQENIQVQALFDHMHIFKLKVRQSITRTDQHQILLSINSVIKK